MEHLNPRRTTWHITFGTYGARLHGDERPTVDRLRNRLGEAFVQPDPARQAREKAAMRSDPVILTRRQQEFIQRQLPAICERGGWPLRTCAAGPDHVHVLCDIDPAIHGERARRLMKRWLTQALNERWPFDPGKTWWAEEGSNKAIHEERYLNNAFDYVQKQRA